MGSVRANGHTRAVAQRAAESRIDRIRYTERLRLEPVALRHAADLWLLHQHPDVAQWHGGPWSHETAHDRAALWAAGWQLGDIHKWVAYDRANGELIGRGGASRQLVAGAERIEIGWTLRADRWGRGYATEIGRAALDLAFDELGADEVVAFTEILNARSRAVMDRLAMVYSRDIEIDGVPYALYTLEARGSITSP